MTVTLTVISKYLMVTESVIYGTENKIKNSCRKVLLYETATKCYYSNPFQIVLFVCMTISFSVAVTLTATSK